MTLKHFLTCSLLLIVFLFSSCKQNECDDSDQKSPLMQLHVVDEYVKPLIGNDIYATYKADSIALYKLEDGSDFPYFDIDSTGDFSLLIHATGLSSGDELILYYNQYNQDTLQLFMNRNRTVECPYVYFSTLYVNGQEIDMELTGKYSEEFYYFKE